MFHLNYSDFRPLKGLLRVRGGVACQNRYFLIFQSSLWGLGHFSAIMNIQLSDILNSIGSLSLEETNQVSEAVNTRKRLLIDEARLEYKKKFDEALKFLVANPPANSLGDKGSLGLLNDVCVAFGYSSDTVLAETKETKKKKPNSNPPAEGEVKRTPGRLTNEQKGQIAHLYSIGKSIKEIADQFGKREELIERTLKMEQK